ncbi:hypothetical protein ACFVZM_20945 [Streptomyces sioyaensis]|uniref:effector-associated constant component EACC1 n=1 Tax=Streptomyces sioyaensis TaxID=67364 RepID=UPI0036B1BB97
MQSTWLAGTPSQLPLRRRKFATHAQRMESIRTRVRENPMTRISISTAAGAKVPDGLRIFLSRDSNMRSVGRAYWPSGEIEPGTLGQSLDVLALVLSNALALPSAIETVRRWVESRGSTSEAVRLTVGKTSIVVSGTEDPDEIRHLAALLQAAFPENGNSNTTT